MNLKAFVLVTGLLLAAGNLQTVHAWGLCGPSLQLPERPPAEFNTDDPELTHVSADDADLVETGVSVLTGNVQILKDGRQLQADHVEYTLPERIIDASGNIGLWDEGMYLSGDEAHLEIDAKAATLDQADFILMAEHAHGYADRVVLSNRDLVTVYSGRYTTCNPDEATWMLEADSIELDRVSELGTGKNVLVMFKGVPIFYSPYLSFPLTDRRKTGFLTPSYRVSGETGFEATLPFYWNIAPNQDATVAARGMTDRGVQLQGEYRYLAPFGQGEAGVEYIPHDTRFDGDRAAFSFDHEGLFAPHWRAELDIAWASDKTYFEDLGTTLEIASRRFLERSGQVQYQRNRFSFLARLQDYQTLDSTIAASRKPYKRLPQLVANYSPPERNRQFNTRIEAETVYFDRDDPSVTGLRYDVKPSVSYPMRNTWSYVIPRATVQYTGYDLSGQTAGLSESPDRFLGYFSTDAGLFFERDFGYGGRNFTQTLEPRLFYLFVPHQGQDDLPDFDTAQRTFSFAQLFRENRFSGTDRVGDANQLTLALTSRLLADNGEEWLRGSIGQIVYFEDREVQLVPGTAVEDDGTSDLVGELSAKVFDDWRMTAGFQWDTDEGRTDRNTVRLRYQPGYDRVANLEYRFVREAVEQTDFSVRWPVNHNWGVVGRWNYSLPESKTLEAFGGVEYDSCCWATRFVVRRFLNSIDGDSDTGVFFQFELTGLAGIGDEAEAFLRKSIPGYRNTF